MHLFAGAICQVRSWSFMSRRELLGIKLRWSYAPAEVKVLTSADGGNFEEASRWRRTARTEPSFEETIMFATPVSVKAVKVLMRGAKPWGYFGLSTVAAVAAPYSFMLVSGAAAIHEQCVVSTPAGLSAKPCVDAIVVGDGHEVFGLTSAGSLQDVSGRCVALEAGKVEFRQCSNVGGVWEMTAEGQVKQGNMCLALGGPGIMFATPVSVKAVKVLMRGAKPWGYFGLSTVALLHACEWCSCYPRAVCSVYTGRLEREALC